MLTSRNPNVTVVVCDPHHSWIQWHAITWNDPPPVYVVILSAMGRAVIVLSVNRVWRLGGGLIAMWISKGQITSTLSTQNRTLSPITSQRCQLIQSDSPSCDADHSHRQLITERMRHFGSVGRASTACWSVTVLRVAPLLICFMREQRFDLFMKVWAESLQNLSSSCYSVIIYFISRL